MGSTLALAAQTSRSAMLGNSEICAATARYILISDQERPFIATD
jgi:hypothetical protein